MKHLCVLFSAMALFAGTDRSNAYNLRQISSSDGLSNSSVMSIIQDSDRFLWIGTYDGLNVYDGHGIRSFKPSINDAASISSNVIKKIMMTSSDYLWLVTKWGLNKFNIRHDRIEENYEEFNESSHFATDGVSKLVILSHAGFISYYQEDRFVNLPIDPDISKENVSGLVMDDSGVIWILHEGVLSRYMLSEDDGAAGILPLEDYPVRVPVRNIFKCDSHIVIVDSEGGLSIAGSGTQTFLADIGDVLEENGNVTDMLFVGEDILIAFRSNGLVRLKRYGDSFMTERINIDCSVYALCKDEKQDIVWIGTDGQGIYEMTEGGYEFGGIRLEDLPVGKHRPVRSLFEDSRGNLWIGTKENGIIRVGDFRRKPLPEGNVTHFVASSGLRDESVFSITANSEDIIWFGMDNHGIDYYDYGDGRIRHLENNTDIPIKYVHSMIASGDTLLWVGAGNELLRVMISGGASGFRTDSIAKFSFNVKNKHRYNQIYAMCFESDTSLWIGMRGNGVINFNTRTFRGSYYNFDENGIAPMNDILSLLMGRNGYLWVGTSYGLIRMDPDTKQFVAYNETAGLANNTIHGMTEERDGKLWLSTNAGLVLFDPERGSFRTYNGKSGLKVYEYSDNAYSRSPRTGTSFFGGIDGVVWIDDTGYVQPDFVPDIVFTGLKIFNTDFNIHDVADDSDGENRIVLGHDQNHFTVQFVALDYLDRGNGRYSYMLENFDRTWISGSKNEAHFTNVNPGKYILHVRYSNGDDNHFSEKDIHIRILEPWWLSWTAKTVYALLLVSILAGAIIFAGRRSLVRKEEKAKKLMEKYKEEMYESKLQFFTNITHEFCTPISLISAPCERIIGSKDASPQIRKYAALIKDNAQRLDSLVNEIINFSKLEAGADKKHIEPVNVTRMIRAILDSFSMLKDMNRISLSVVLPEETMWNTDRRYFDKIVSNLVSNAFKYTPETGSIGISLDIADTLVFSVRNSGKGIPEKYLQNIFNRYFVLDQVTERSNGLPFRNGLGLPIVHNMVESLGGRIDVESVENDCTQFTVRLPYVNADGSDCDSAVPDTPKDSRSLKDAGQDECPVSSGRQHSILVIDDNKDMLWLLQDIFSDRYQVMLAESAEEGLEIMKVSPPSLIITDIMMPGIDGIALVKMIRSNQYFTRVPIIILTAKNTDENKLEGIDSGADLYVTKPFDIGIISASVDKLIEKYRTIESFYSSSAASLDFMEGGSLVNKEDAAFVRTVTGRIAENIGNNGFTAEKLAESIGVSVRNLYRKFKDLGLPSPKVFIKNQRIDYACRLLMTTSLTLEEIMYRCGFMSRSHFNKEFSQREGMSPGKYRIEHKNP